MKRKTTPYAETEKAIENQILHFLELKGIFAWKNQTTGIFDAKKRIFRKSMNRFHLKGVADILGIYDGKPLAIEVKSAKGRVSKEQLQFLIKFGENGGLALIAHSVEDVKRELGL